MQRDLNSVRINGIRTFKVPKMTVNFIIYNISKVWMLFAHLDGYIEDIVSS